MNFQQKNSIETNWVTSQTLVILLFILQPSFETFCILFESRFSVQKWFGWCHGFIKWHHLLESGRVLPCSLPFSNESENSIEFRNFWKLVILNTCYDFRSGLYTLTVCLKSWYHNYVRIFYVTCIPFAYQPKWKEQSAVIHPVCMEMLKGLL